MFLLLAWPKRLFRNRACRGLLGHSFEFDAMTPVLSSALIPLASEFHAKVEVGGGFASLLKIEFDEFERNPF